MENEKQNQENSPHYDDPHDDLPPGYPTKIDSLHECLIVIEIVLNQIICEESREQREIKSKTIDNYLIRIKNLIDEIDFISQVRNDE